MATETNNIRFEKLLFLRFIEVKKIFQSFAKKNCFIFETQIIVKLYRWVCIYYIKINTMNINKNNNFKLKISNYVYLSLTIEKNGE